MKRARFAPLMLLLLAVVAVGCEGGCNSAQKANTAADRGKYDAVVPILREHAQAHPETHADIEEAIASYTPGGDVAKERAWKWKVEPYLRAFASEHPDRKLRTEDLLDSWEERLQAFEKPKPGP
jgi:hypothetical protein